MSIHDLQQAKRLRGEFERLGRAGISERIFTLVDEFNKNRSYKNAVVLAGRLKAIAQACKADSYWDEKCSTGYQFEFHDLQRVSKIGTLEDGKESWWIK